MFRRPTPPAKMDNNENRCFANVVIQALDGVPEFRDYMVSKAEEANDAVMKQFPALKERREACIKQSARSVRWSRDMIVADPRCSSLRVCLGRNLGKMESAAEQRTIFSTHAFLQVFGKRHPDYNGSKQQESFDFLEKLLQQLGEEEVDAGEVGADDIPFAKKLFAGKTVTQVCASGIGRECCGCLG